MPVKLHATNAIRAWGDGYGSVVIEEYYNYKIAYSVKIHIGQLERLLEELDRLKHEAYHGPVSDTPRE